MEGRHGGSSNMGATYAVGSPAPSGLADRGDSENGIRRRAPHRQFQRLQRSKRRSGGVIPQRERATRLPDSGHRHIGAPRQALTPPPKEGRFGYSPRSKGPTMLLDEMLQHLASFEPNDPGW